MTELIDIFHNKNDKSCHRDIYIDQEKDCVEDMNRQVQEKNDQISTM